MEETQFMINGNLVTIKGDAKAIFDTLRALSKASGYDVQVMVDKHWTKLK